MVQTLPKYLHITNQMMVDTIPYFNILHDFFIFLGEIYIYHLFG